MPAAPQFRSDPAREESELRAYLGADFDETRLWHYERQLEEEFEEMPDEERFYRTSFAYLYNLTAFAMTETKVPYLRELLAHVPPGARILDYGCGIGSDGLMLLEAGYRVEFADFDNPSTRYLLWRLERRGLEAPIHRVDGDVPDGFDAAYSFDVIEHVQDPFAFLDELESRAALVAVNLLEPAPGEPPFHHELPVPELLGRIAKRRLVSYRLMYGRSNLALYQPECGSPLSRSAARSRIRVERLRRRWEERVRQLRRWLRRRLRRRRA
jgi:SAM-dependent methyltransferase